MRIATSGAPFDNDELRAAVERLGHPRLEALLDRLEAVEDAAYGLPPPPPRKSVSWDAAAAPPTQRRTPSLRSLWNSPTPSTPTTPSKSLEIAFGLDRAEPERTWRRKSSKTVSAPFETELPRPSRGLVPTE